MKKTCLLLLITFFSLQSFGQKVAESAVNPASVDQRIVEVFGDQLATLVLNDPQRLKSLNDILLNRTEIKKIPIGTRDKYVKLSTMPLFNKYNPNLQRDVPFNKDNFNVLKYNLEFFARSTKIYRIDNTDLVIVIHPQTQIK